MTLTWNIAKLQPVTEAELIARCQREEPEAQKKLYEQYAPTLFGVVRRYVSGREDAEDILLEGFFKIFTNIHKYRGNGSFEGWMRRIVINEALMFLRKNHALRRTVDIDDLEIPRDETIVAQLSAQEIYNLLDELPTGYRTVFNLYVMEGYKHREIAELLGISINTSKSQLIFAKKRLQERLLEMYPTKKQ